MIRNLFSLLRRATLLSVAVLTVFTQFGQAQSPEGLRFSKNWFVTGDVAFTSIALRSTGNGSTTTAPFHMRGVPCIDVSQTPPAIVPADPATGSCLNNTKPTQVVAAYVYWMVEET